MKEVNERVGRNIRQFRMKKGYTQETLGNRVGITKQAVCRVEKSGAATQATLERIATALNIDINELYMKHVTGVSEKVSEVLCNNFIKENVKNSTITNEFEILYKKIHDEAVRGFADKITLSQTEKFKNYVLPELYNNSEQFSRNEVIDLCMSLNKNFIVNIYSILTGD